MSPMILNHRSMVYSESPFWMIITTYFWTIVSIYIISTETLTSVTQIDFAYRFHRESIMRLPCKLYCRVSCQTAWHSDTQQVGLSSLGGDELSCVGPGCCSFLLTQATASSLLTFLCSVHCSFYPLSPLVQNAPLFSICVMPISCLSPLIHASHRDKGKHMIALSVSTQLSFNSRSRGLSQKCTRKTCMV